MASSLSSALFPTSSLSYSNVVAESLRHNRDRLAIQEQETDLRLEIVRTHRRQFEQILTLHLERIMMSAAAQKASLFEILTGSPTHVTGSQDTRNHNANKTNGRSSPPRSSAPKAKNILSPQRSAPAVGNRQSPASATSFSASPTACRNVSNLPAAQLVASGDDGNNSNNNSSNNYFDTDYGDHEYNQQDEQCESRRSPGHHRYHDPNMVTCKRLFAGASAKSLGRMSRVIPMTIPNTNDIKRRHACFAKLRQDIAEEQTHLQEFVEAEERRRAAYEKSREQLFRKAEEKSLKDRLRHDLAMKRRPPEVGIEKAVASDAKLMRVEERKRQKEIALQALADTRRQIWIRTQHEVDWAKQTFLEQQRVLQSRVNRTVLDSQDQRKRTDSDLTDISIIANIHRRSHRAEAANRRREVAAEQSRLLNLSRAVTERNFESTGITVETSWEEEKSPMPPTGRSCRVAEISDGSYDRLCGTPRAPIPKFAGAADALKHMSTTAWDAMSELQHDARLRALEFARFHSAGKMPPVAWK